MNPNDEAAMICWGSQAHPNLRASGYMYKNRLILNFSIMGKYIAALSLIAFILSGCTAFSAYGRIDESYKQNIRVIGVVSLMDDMFTVVQIGPILAFERGVEQYILGDLQIDAVVTDVMSAVGKQAQYQIKIFEKPEDTQNHLDTVKKVLVKAKDAGVDVLFIVSRTDVLNSDRATPFPYMNGFGQIQRNTLLTKEQCLFLNYYAYLVDVKSGKILLSAYRMEHKCNDGDPAIHLNDFGQMNSEQLSQLKEALRKVAERAITSTMKKIGLSKGAAR